MTTAHLYIDAAEWPRPENVVPSADGKWNIRLLDTPHVHIRIYGTPDQLRTFGTHLIDTADRIDRDGDR